MVQRGHLLQGGEEKMGSLLLFEKTGTPHITGESLTDIQIWGLRKKGGVSAKHKKRDSHDKATGGNRRGGCQKLIRILQKKDTGQTSLTERRTASPRCTRSQEGFSLRTAWGDLNLEFGETLL